MTRLQLSARILRRARRIRREVEQWLTDSESFSDLQVSRGQPPFVPPGKDGMVAILAWCDQVIAQHKQIQNESH